MMWRDIYPALNSYLVWRPDISGVERDMWRPIAPGKVSIVAIFSSNALTLYGVFLFPHLRSPIRQKSPLPPFGKKSYFPTHNSFQLQPISQQNVRSEEVFSSLLKPFHSVGTLSFFLKSGKCGNFYVLTYSCLLFTFITFMVKCNLNSQCVRQMLFCCWKFIRFGWRGLP